MKKISYCMVMLHMIALLPAETPGLQDGDKLYKLLINQKAVSAGHVRN